MGGRVRVSLVLEHVIACVLDLGVSMRDRLIKVGCIFGPVGWIKWLTSLSHTKLKGLRALFLIHDEHKMK